MDINNNLHKHTKCQGQPYDIISVGTKITSQNNRIQAVDGVKDPKTFSMLNLFYREVLLSLVFKHVILNYELLQ